jgi:DNA modification methylase
MGTGTTAIACQKFNGMDNNMICIGSEISEKQVEYSKERLDKFLKEKQSTTHELKIHGLA